MNDKAKEIDQPVAPGTGPKSEKSGNKFLLLGIVVGIIIIQASVVYFIVPRGTNPEAKTARVNADSLRAAAEIATRMGATTIDAPIEAVVNIAGTDGERFLKAAIILEYNEKNVELGAELRRRAPRYKDLLLDHLSKLTLIEVTEPEARDKIRKDLLRLINNTLPVKMGEVRDVLFTQFIIQ